MNDTKKALAKEEKRRTSISDGRARRRSDGVLSQAEVAEARKAGTRLAYDPVQIGWLPLDVEDDIRPALGPVRSKAPEFEPRALAPVYRFRPWTEADLTTYHALLDDEDVWEYMYEEYPDPLTVDLSRELIALSNAGDHHDVQAVLVNFVPAGQMRLKFDLSTPEAPAEVSYWFGRDYWGRGIATGALTVFVSQSFRRHAGLDTMIARAHADNPASHRVLSKAGFVADGPDPNDPAWHVFRQTRARSDAIAQGIAAYDV